MALILKPGRWSQPPPPGTRLNRSNSLARALTLFVMPGAWPVRRSILRANEAIFAPYINAGSPKYVGSTRSDFGRIYRTSSDADDLRLGTSTSTYSIAAGKRCIFAIFRTTETFYGGLFVLRSTSSAPIVSMCVGYNGVTTAAGNLLAITRDDANTLAHSLNPNLTCNDGKWHIGYVIDDGTNWYTGLDGKRVIFGNSPTNARGVISPMPLRSGVMVEPFWIDTATQTVDQRYLNGDFLYGGLVEGFTPPDALLKSLLDDPWQIFEPDLVRTFHFFAGGAAAITGTASITEAGDSVSSAGTVAIAANAALQETDDSLASAATASITTTATLQEAGDLLASTGTVIAAGAVADASIIEADDLVTSAVTVAISGAAALQESDDAITGTTTVSLTATAALAEAGDTLLSEGGTAQFATADITEADDLLSATGTVVFGVITGTAAIQEADDALTATGVVVSGVTASASIIERGDIVVADGTVLVLGSLNITEADDTAIGLASSVRTADASIQEADDRLSATVVQRIARHIAVSDTLCTTITSGDSL